MQDRQLRIAFRLGTKSAAYAVIAVVAIYALFRVVVPYTWGMHSDLAPLVTIACVIFGGIGMAFMIYAMVKDLIRENRAAEAGGGNSDD